MSGGPGLLTALESESDHGHDHDHDHDRYRLGVTCILTATFFTSLAGILLRQIETADGWQILFYRSLAFIATMLLFILFRHGRRTPQAFLAIGKPGLVLACVMGAAFMCFVFAVLNTTVANVVFTVSLSPFFVALFAWLALRETISRSTAGAMVLSLVGVSFIFSDGLVAGTMTGNLLALATSLLYSASIVAMRWGKGVDMIPAVCLAGVVSAVVSGVMAPDLVISRFDLGIAITLGVFQLAFQYILVTTGTRYVPAAETALMGRLTLVLAPLWVWIGVGEVPGDLSLIGGAIVFCAIMANGVLTLRSAQRLSA